MTDLPPQRRIEFGFPVYWEKIEESFSVFFSVAKRLEISLKSITDRAYDSASPLQFTILQLGDFVGISLMELITLVGNGFGVGAMKIARSMLEAAVNAEYLRRVPSAFEDFKGWAWVEQQQLLQYMNANDKDRYLRVDQKEVERAENKYTKVKERFLVQGSRGRQRLRQSWCSLSLSERVEKTEFTDCYIAYRLASRILHATIGGISSYYNPKADEHRIEIPPSLEWCGETLCLGHFCALRTTQTLSLTLSVEPSHSVSELLKDYEYAWGSQKSATTPVERP